MTQVFQCPRCGESLGSAETPQPDPLPACPRCGWRAAKPEESSRVAGHLLRLALLAAGGLVAGALVARSMYFVPFAFVALGPLAAARIGRWFRPDWLPTVLTYSVAFGAGILLSPDGETIPPRSWGIAITAVVITLAVGWLVGWLSLRD